MKVDFELKPLAHCISPDFNVYFTNNNETYFFAEDVRE